MGGMEDQNSPNRKSTSWVLRHRAQWREKENSLASRKLTSRQLTTGNHPTNQLSKLASWVLRHWAQPWERERIVWPIDNSPADQLTTRNKPTLQIGLLTWKASSPSRHLSLPLTTAKEFNHSGNVLTQNVIFREKGKLYRNFNKNSQTFYSILLRRADISSER